MRYRPFGASGMAVSAVTLGLADGPARLKAADWEMLVYAALENGINSFEVMGRQPAIAEGLALAMQAIERPLVCISWRLGSVIGPSGEPMRDFSPAGLERSVDSILTSTGLGYLDVALLDDPQAEELKSPALAALKAMRDSGRVRMLGVEAGDDAIDTYIAIRAFDAVCLPFNLVSTWKDRHRLKSAGDNDMAVTALDYYPQQFEESAEPVAKHSHWGLGGGHPLRGAGTYAFLDRTQGWTGEEVCLAYALTNPAVATIRFIADQPARVEALAAVVERDLPTGVSAQIEMARFSPEQAAAKRRA
jgi:aryl-alcohol dehydrogenase-like predicted oxidoreductase